MSTPARATPVVFIPALLCDEQLDRDVIAALGDAIEPHVLLSPKPRLEDSVAEAGAVRSLAWLRAFADVGETG